MENEKKHEIRAAVYNGFGGVDCEIKHGGRWVPFTANNKSGDSFVQNVWDALPSVIAPADFEQKKARAHSTIKAMHDTLVLKMAGNPSALQQRLWDMERQWAQGFTNNGDARAKAHLLSVMTAEEITEHGDVSAGFMAAKIMGKDAYFSALAAAAAGIRRTAEKAVEAALTEDDIAAAFAGAMSAVQIEVAKR